MFGSKVDVPIPKKVQFNQEVHGCVFKDNFAWLKDGNAKDVQEYVKDENRYAHHCLEDTTFFQKILKREMKHWLPLCHELESVPERIDNYFYYIKSPPEGDDRLPVICRRAFFKSESVNNAKIYKFINLPL
ncbi:Protease 2 [Exaiptasia diaphana]|nr:Protease 2 [Exaiptasia diaphana]